MLKAVFIDFDGTLVNSIPYLYQLYHQFLKQFGIEGTVEEFELLNGKPILEALDLLVDRHRVKISRKEVREFYLDKLRYMYTNEVEIFKDAKDTITRLREHRLCVAIVTSATREFVHLILNRFSISSRTDSRLGTRSVLSIRSFRSSRLILLSSM